MTPIFRTPLEVMDLWIAALRSGEYTQTTGKLKRTHTGYEGFCCLGVLCDLARKDGGEDWEASKSSPGLWYYKDRGADIPWILANYLSLNADQRSRLISMNDSARKSFPEIADYIEANFRPCLVKPE
jgi:hypothetical protein